MATLPVYNPEIPYLGLIPGGIRHGSMIRINGTMPYGGNRFTINLQTGAATRPRDDTALHLSVRPTDPVIVRNHFENKIWGAEERFGGCPIHPGQPFEILILAESNAFKIAINGVHFCHFNHRFSMQRVTFISVESDVTIASITMGSDAPSAPPIVHPLPMPAPIHPYPPSMSYPGVGHRPHFPHYPAHGHHSGHGHHPGHHHPGYIPGPPPPPPYSPTPYPGHRYPYMQARDDSVTSASAYSLQNDSNYLRRNNRNNAIKYAAVGAGVAGGVGLGAFALSRAFGGGDDGGNDGGDDVGGDFGGEE